jgi:hypothetical protein
MVDFGVIIADVDSGPPESNDKPDAKALSHYAQMQADGC